MPSLGLSLGLSHLFPVMGFTGLLDTFPGAAAAYSLRALTRNWVAGDVVEVRRGSNSDTMSFTESQIISGAMLSFVNHDTTDLYNSARYLSGSGSMVSSASANVAADISFSSTFIPPDSGGSDSRGLLSQYTGSPTGGGFAIRRSNTGSIRFVGYDAAGFIGTIESTEVMLEGVTSEFTVTYTHSTRAVSITINGDVHNGVLSRQISSNAADMSIGEFNGTSQGGVFLDVSLDIGGSPQFAYTGLGTSVTAWEDTIASNDGTETNGAAYTGQPFDGFVSTWYDQSGEGNDATQATTTSQPKIVDAGSLVVGGLLFDGADDFLPIPPLGQNINNLSSFCVGARDSVTGTPMMLSLGTSANNARWYAPFCIGDTFVSGYATNGNVASFSSDTNVHLHTAIAGSTQGNFSSFMDGSMQGSATLVSALPGAAVVGIGGQVAPSSFPLDGRVAEVLVYKSDQSVNRTGIETNLQAAYPLLP